LAADLTSISTALTALTAAMPTLVQGALDDQGYTEPRAEALDNLDYPVSTLGGGAGGGVLSARVSGLALPQKKFYEIVQGEEKTITFVVEADGRFNVSSSNEIIVKFQDSEGHVEVVLDEDIQRITEELDIQVFRATLTEEQTDLLTPGLIKVEIEFDEQKAILTQAVKVLEEIAYQEV
jgi:hypothetical protein